MRKRMREILVRIILSWLAPRTIIRPRITKDGLRYRGLVQFRWLGIIWRTKSHTESYPELSLCMAEIENYALLAESRGVMGSKASRKARKMMRRAREAIIS
jgi:hypothetical protein